MAALFFVKKLFFRGSKKLSSANVKMCGVTLPYIYIKKNNSFFFWGGSFGEGAYVVLVHSTSHRISLLIQFLFVRDKVL